MLIVKSFNLGQNSNSKMRQAILDSKDKNLKLERTFVPYNMLQQIILYGTSILVIVDGLYFYLNGTMALSICLLMTVASFMLFGQLQSAGNTSALLRLLDVSIDKVNEIDKTPVMDEHGKPVKSENYNIVFDDVAHLVPELTANLCIPICILIYLLFLDWRMALAALITLPIGMLCYKGMANGYEEKFQGLIMRVRKMTSTVVEYIGGIEVIKAFNQSANSYQKYSDAVEDNASYAVKGCMEWKADSWTIWGPFG